MFKKDHFIEYYMEKVDFPKEAQVVFLSLNDKFESQKEQQVQIGKLMKSFMEENLKTDILLNQLDSLANEMDTHNYTMHLFFFMMCTAPLYEKYKESGISEEIYWYSVSDLKYKLIECFDVHGIWGTFVASWFPGFYRLERFALGRFQYQPTTFSYDRYEKNGIIVNKGDLVYNMHIPSSGSMNKELRMDSYQKAYDFYSKDGKPLVIVCHSWLLYKEHEKFLPAHLNVLDFMRDFDIIDSIDEEEFRDAWRIFGKQCNEKPENLPMDTSLRKAFANRLINKEKTGMGFGILLFDGERIL